MLGNFRRRSDQAQSEVSDDKKGGTGTFRPCRRLLFVNISRFVAQIALPCQVVRKSPLSFSFSSMTNVLAYVIPIDKRELFRVRRIRDWGEVSAISCIRLEWTEYVHEVLPTRNTRARCLSLSVFKTARQRYGDQKRADTVYQVVLYRIPSK